jgi:glucose/mannose transport system substrate-binding protein
MFGCASTDDAETATSVEIFSWWSSESETTALDSMLAVHAKHHPNVRVINAAEELAEKARARLTDRMRRGLPPDTFQANIGRDLFQWVLFDERDDSETKVAALNDLAEEHDWFDTFAEPVLEALSYDGRLYGVPMNIHRINTLFYNKRVLDAEGLAVPEDVEELESVLAELVSRGYEHPMSIGNRHNWTMSLFTMENLFPAVAGGDFYVEFWAGEHEPEHELMHETLRQLLELWPYFNDDAMDVTWTVGVERLFEEDKQRQAVFTVMGDWAKGHLQFEGYEPNVDFGSVPFPGSQGTFVFTSDCFPLPKGAPHRDQVTELLVSFGSKKGQLAFNSFKGSLPARIDIDPKEDLDELARVTWRDFRSDELVMALSGLLDSDFADSLALAIRETLEDQDPDPVLFSLRNNLQ